MAKFPKIEYNRKDGQSVTMKLPDDTDIWSFLAYMDHKFLGLTEESMIARRKEFDAWKAQQVKGKRK